MTGTALRKILVSVKFVSAILGPEMGASIKFLWTPGKCALSAGKTNVHKIIVLGGVFWVLGGGSADFIFMGARIFLTALRVRLANFSAPRRDSQTGGSVREPSSDLRESRHL